MFMPKRMAHQVIIVLIMDSVTVIKPHLSMVSHKLHLQPHHRRHHLMLVKSLRLIKIYNSNNNSKLNLRNLIKILFEWKLSAGFATNGSVVVAQPQVTPMATNAAPITGCAPPPPPPPPTGLNQGQGSMDMSSLAAQLQQAKLKRNAKSNATQPPAENSGSSTSSGGSNYSTGRSNYQNIHELKLTSLYVDFIKLGRSSTGMASMMDEMAKTLARRRAQAEKKPDVSSEIPIVIKLSNLRKSIILLCFNRRTLMISPDHGRNRIHYHIN